MANILQLSFLFCHCPQCFCGNSICLLLVYSQGLVVVWELNQERRGKPERIHVSSEHKGRKVTALCWDTAVLRVFVGDHVGKVSAIKLNTLKQAKVRNAPAPVCPKEVTCGALNAGFSFICYIL